MSIAALRNQCIKGFVFFSICYANALPYTFFLLLLVSHWYNRLLLAYFILFDRRSLFHWLLRNTVILHRCFDFFILIILFEIVIVIFFQLLLHLINLFSVSFETFIFFLNFLLYNLRYLNMGVILRDGQPIHFLCELTSLIKLFEVDWLFVIEPNFLAIFCFSFFFVLYLVFLL